MKRVFLFLISVMFSFSAFALDLCPLPQKAEISETEHVPFEKIEIVCPDKTALAWAENHLKEWYGEYAPQVVSAKGNTSAMEEEEYSIKVNKKATLIAANTLQGVRYALYTMRQLAIAKRGTSTVQGWIVPVATIEDKPDMEWRGMHICWFHENQPWEIERMIRLAAYYKLNYAVIEPWGTFRSSVAPWYGWSDGSMTHEEINRLKAIADDLGITLIPQLNIFGHATSARYSTGKHAALDLHPEYQPYFEPEGGWNWCLSNPHTIKLQKELIKELYEAFGCPPYIHIGCDEAEKPSCPDCIEQTYAKLLVNHITEISDYIKKLGAKTLIWHDMLIKKGDPRWKGFTANGTNATIALLDKLSKKDVVICDWCYKQPRESYPTMSHFKNLGFKVFSCPWDRKDGTRALLKNAHKEGVDGVLGTIWHHFYGKSLVSIYYNVATFGWSKAPAIKGNPTLSIYNHFRQVGWDMKNTDPRHAGTYYNEVPYEPSHK